jgi:hypothetical protein
MRGFMFGAALAAVSAFSAAHALGRVADVSVIDRESGIPLEMHYWRGQYWVAGEPGARYAIEVRNRARGRVLAVTSVDGVNVVTGETAGWNQSGYVLDPEADYQIAGWRKSHAVIAAFAFTAASNSYAERTGRPDNVGVIGVALFREQALLSPPIASASVPPRAEAAPSAREQASAAAPLPAAAPLSADLATRLQVPAPALGTAHGEREVSYVGHTRFVRQRTEPDEIIRIRYDSRENLIAMGIIREPRYPPGPSPDPFPTHEQSYVADPPPG